MNLKCNFILLCIVLSNQLYSSDETNNKDKKIFWGANYMFPSFEYVKVDNSDINTLLNSADLPTIGQEFVNYGFTIQFNINGIMPMIGYNRKTNINGDNTLHQRYSSLSINIGYDLFRHPKYWLYPYIGYKNCEIYYLYNQYLEDKTIEDYLTEKMLSKEITNSRSHLDIGIGASALRFFTFTLRVGLLIPIEKTYWETNNSKIRLSNVPNIDYKYYFIISFGIGATNKDEE